MKKLIILLLVLIVIFIGLHVCLYNWCQQNNVDFTFDFYKEIILSPNASDISGSTYIVAVSD